MGYLENGVWHEGWYDTASTGGRFVRWKSRFRDWVTADGSSGFKAEPGRYRLFVSLACPWAHRTVIFRRLKRLEDVVAMTVVDPVIGDGGWRLPDGRGLFEVYLAADPAYSGRVTTPVLWDERRRTIVNNESAEIIRMLNSAFDAFGDASVDFYPEPLRQEIDRINALVYEAVNNGVYRAGFAGSQEAYEEAFDQLFRTLDDLDDLLGRRRWVAGDGITEADWRLFTTLVRFDAVYYVHFKCNGRRIADYPNLAPYLRDLYQVPGVAETVDFDHIKRHYYLSHRHLNPSGLVPKGPFIDLRAPHGRERFGP